ncbi:BcsR/BcsP family cellulose biosynthesis protein [Cupriavidus nantongensis]
MKPANARGLPLARSDIDVLGNEVDGFDPRRYFDHQEMRAAQAAARRWPLLAGLLGYDAVAPHAITEAAERG